MDFSTLIAPLSMSAAAAGGVLMMAINLRKARTIEDTPTEKIRSAAQGYISLNGFARGLEHEQIHAPLTGTHCLWYRYTIERYDSDKRGSSWDTVESGSSSAFFRLDDRTGSCHVDPRHADVTATIRQRWEGNDRHPGDSSKNLLGNLFGQRYRYTEERIHADEWIYLLGWFETLHAPSFTEQTAMHTKALLNEWKNDRAALLAKFDVNRDGDIDLQEWERARQAATQQAQHYVQQQPGALPVNIVARPPLRDRPFIIASKDPQQLASRYRWRAFIALLIGLGAAVYIGWDLFGAF
jgi:hypothetical protein